MALPQRVANSNMLVNSDLLEKVILQNDLSGLSPIEKVEHIKNVCVSLGLNPLTKPIQLHKFQGKEVMYMGKDGTEQIRNIHDVSIIKLKTELLNGDLYIVKAYAQKPSGRRDCSTSAISLSGLKGEAIGNAMKKCETQAKRRVTLSICGLGMLDESEIVDLPKDLKPQYKIHENIKPISIDIAIEEFLLNISQANNLDELQEIFKNTYKIVISLQDKDALKKIIDAKDAKKAELEMVKEFNQEIDKATGEVLS
jgi:hypothetical protein